MDFLRTYKNEHRPGDDDDDDDEKEPGPVAAGLDTYAGEWYSRDAGGTFVLAFTDDPKPHLEAIRRRRPPETGDWPVDVVRAPHTESEVKAAQKKVSKMFKQLRGRPNLKSYAYYSALQRSRVIESATEIRIAMGVIPPTGAQNCLGHGFDPITIKLAAPIGQRKIVDGLFLPPRPLLPKSLRIPRPYRRNLMIHALAFALAVLAMARAAMAVRRWRRANAEVRRWRRARDHAS